MKIIKSKAFSLIEVSIVILIVGFIIAAITQSSRLLKSTRISAARAFTANSAISSDKASAGSGGSVVILGGGGTGAVSFGRAGGGLVELSLGGGFSDVGDKLPRSVTAAR